MDHGPRLLRYVGSAALVLLISTGGCTERRAVTASGPQPVGATAYPRSAPGGGQVAQDPPQDIQELRIAINDGRFGADRYDAQSRATRMYVTTQGGPYVLVIDSILQPRSLQANGITEIEFTLPNPGEYTMRLTEGADATAVLNVRSAGSR